MNIMKHLALIFLPLIIVGANDEDDKKCEEYFQNITTSIATG